MLRFPPGFVWGAGTSAYQVEGAVAADGRGPSIWDTFARVAGGDTGEVACDHHHRYKEDVALMKELGLTAYRFSVAWPRIQPEGQGLPNPAGLDFYERLVDELRGAGIAPYVTLYHWDLPQALEDRGGWTNRDTALRFTDYAQAVHQRLGDRVDTWLTVNEPWVQASLGYGMGLHAPGRASAAAAFTAAHHLMLAHGLGTRLLREAGARRIGIPLNLAPVMTPAQVSEPGAPVSEADAEAIAQIDTLLNLQFLDPALTGRYPERLLDIVERECGLGHLHDGDLEAINQPIDLLGVNYYAPTIVRAQAGEAANPAFPGTRDVLFCDSHVTATAMGWPIVPSGLSLLLRSLAERHPGLELVVSENGAAFSDTLTGSAIHDADRTAFLDEHLRAVHHAIESGVPCTGYLVWSLLDNFEWSEGYASKFGIVHVDRQTQQRRIKDSGRWYHAVIERNGLQVGHTRRPTLETVAARAGVSRATVSRVINGEAAVSPKMREVVLRTVNLLGYVPNAAARNLVTQRTNTVALVLSTRDEATIAALVLGAGRALQAAGKQIMLMLADSADSRAHIVRRVESGHVDGVMIVPGHGGDPLIERLYGAAVPMAVLGRPAFTSLVPYVELDNVSGAATATNHLLGLGRRRIAMICGPMEHARVQDRLSGYRDTMREAGLQPFLTVGDFSRQSGEEAARRLLGDDPSLDAIFAANDLMALGALEALRVAGRRVPEDVAVVGFGDVEAAAEAGLTTVGEGLHDQAQALAGLLLSRLEGRPTGPVLLPARLTGRATA